MEGAEDERGSCPMGMGEFQGYEANMMDLSSTKFSIQYLANMSKTAIRISMV